MKYRIYLGYDSREHIAFDVARHSILSRTNPKEVQIRPLELPHLQAWLGSRPIEHRDGKLWCPISEAPMATEFAISRFVVPFLQDKGWAVFADCDIVCLADIRELFALADPKYAVMVVKHRPREVPTTKMDGQENQPYPKKLWSSVVLWNCEHPAHKNLTLEALCGWPGRDLHAFKWLKGEEIGELPPTWNYLVGLDQFYVFGDNHLTKPRIAHFTLGGPWLGGSNGPEWDALWLSEVKAAGIPLPEQPKAA